MLPFKRAGDQDCEGEIIGECQSRPEIQLRTLVPLAVRVQIQVSGIHVEEREQVPVFMQGRIIFITQPVIHSQRRRELPFVLHEEDIIVLLQEPVARHSAMQRVRGAYVAQNLHCGGIVIH